MAESPQPPQSKRRKPSRHPGNPNDPGLRLTESDLGDFSPIKDPSCDSGDVFDPEVPPEKNGGPLVEDDGYSFDFHKDGQEMFHDADAADFHEDGTMSGGWVPPPAAAHGLGLRRNGGTTRSGNQQVATRSGGATTTSTRTTSHPGRYNGTAKSKDDRQEFVNDHILRRLIREAEFELQHDPYRGMLLDGRPDAAAAVVNPWKTCQYTEVDPKNKERNMNAILNPMDKLPNGVPSDHLVAKIWVEETAQCSCSSLVEWTEPVITKDRQASKKKGNKKRKPVEEEEEEKPKPPLVGQRPEDPDARCPCDYNPYCIVSVGGVLNTMWQQEAAKVLKNKQQLQKNYQEQLAAYNASQRPKIVQNILSLLPKLKSTPKENKVISVDSDDEVQPMDIDLPESTDPEIANRYENIEYSPSVRKTLRQLRPPISVKTASVKQYLASLLSCLPHEQTKDVSVDELLQIFRQWQKNLIFENPLEQNHLQDEETSSTFHIAAPPGISNLGATCYLNTQLQCLAQNKAFLKGMFSWRSSANKEAKGHAAVMNNVLTQLQSLLAQMVEGSQRTMTTLEFSTALGLENDEQQDPNEFARLLFERMHEAFQQQPSLARLLPSLFEGSTTYETTCLTCKTMSTRRETFMDLNLPIVIPKSGDSSYTTTGKTMGAKTIFDYFGRQEESASVANPKADTDVQYCLDMYSTQEPLNGDNQYFCSSCSCKRDAVRETTLGKLPPVLNVQLSRYVFDRKTLTKKKLTEKVLLPRKLRVRTKVSDAAGDATTTKTYVLCAVMKHHGTSAYRGHYVAEVQDFLSGQWFEFNDEKVKLLEKGPSCSYEPPCEYPEQQELTDSDDDWNQRKGGKRQPLKVEGSSDAYNMYYVEESYLAGTTMQTLQGLQRQLDQLNRVFQDKEEPLPDDVLQSVAQVRVKLFSELSDMCNREGSAHNRIEKRKRGIIAHMFSSRAAVRDARAPPVWVSADLFRRFVSGKDRLEDLFRVPAEEPLLRHRQLLCSHKKPGLHPRMARRGKLLPRSIYDNYERLLLEERCNFVKEITLDESNDESRMKPISDCIITPESNMSCEACTQSYRKKLREKLDFVQALIHIYVELKDGHGDVFMGPCWREDSDLEEDEYPKEAFVATRKGLTALRKLIETGFLKGLGNITATVSNSSPSNAVSIDVDTKCQSDESSVLDEDARTDSPSEGLDGLDLSSFSPEALRGAKDFDETINASITCVHGNCNVGGRFSRTARFLKPDLWKAIKKVCPDAIEHKMSREKPVYDCHLCRSEERSKQDIFDKILQWYNATLKRGDDSLYRLYRQPENDETLAKIVDVVGADFKSEAEILGDYFPVAREDIVLWRKLMDASKQKTKDLILKIEGLLLARTQEWANHARTPLERGVLRRLTCSRHHLALPIFVPLSGGNTDDTKLPDDHSDETRELAPGIQLLTKHQYENFVGSFVDLCLVLEPKADDVVDLCQDDDEEETNQKPVPKVLQPPKLVLLSHKTHEDDDNLVDGQLIQLSVAGGNPVRLLLSPRICLNKDCCNELKTEEDKGETLRPPGRAAGNTINLVESDVDDDKETFKLKVFEVEAGALIDEAMHDLREAQLLPGMGNASASEPLLRRSSRKRNAKLPYNSILRQDTVDVALHHNFAAVRLLFMQNNEQFPLYQKLFLVFAPEFGEEAPLPPKEVPFVANEKVLKDAYVEMTSDEKLERLGDPAISLVLLRQTDPEDSVPNEALMDVLLETANTISKDSDESKGSKKRRAAERGFHGTLLSSFGASAEDTTTTSAKEEMKIQSSSVVMPVDKNRESSDDHHGQQPAYGAATGPVSDETSVASSHKGDQPPESAERVRKKAKLSPKQETKTKSDERSPERDTIERSRLPNREKAETRTPRLKKPQTGSVLEHIGVSENDPVSDLVEEVMKGLLDIFPGRDDDCWVAAKWAVEKNGSTVVHELICAAMDRVI